MPSYDEQWYIRTYSAKRSVIEHDDRGERLKKERESRRKGKFNFDLDPWDSGTLISPFLLAAATTKVRGMQLGFLKNILRDANHHHNPITTRLSWALIGLPVSGPRPGRDSRRGEFAAVFSGTKRIFKISLFGDEWSTVGRDTSKCSNTAELSDQGQVNVLGVWHLMALRKIEENSSEKKNPCNIQGSVVEPYYQVSTINFVTIFLKRLHASSQTDFLYNAFRVLGFFQF